MVSLTAMLGLGEAAVPVLVDVGCIEARVEGTDVGSNEEAEVVLVEVCVS